MADEPKPDLRDGRFVLAVDDDATELKLIERALEKDFIVHGVSTVNEALAVLGGAVPALVILDVMMPDLSGLDLCQILKRDERLQSVPVIFVSACDSPGDYSAGHDAGAVAYLAKPLRRDRLLNTVKMLARTAARSE